MTNIISQPEKHVTKYQPRSMSSETYRKVADPSRAPSFVKGRGTQRVPAVPGWLYVVAVAAAAEAALSAGVLHVEPQGRSQT